MLQNLLQEYIFSCKLIQTKTKKCKGNYIFHPGIPAGVTVLGNATAVLSKIYIRHCVTSGNVEKEMQSHKKVLLILP